MEVVVTDTEFDSKNEFDATLDNEGTVDTDADEVVLVDCVKEALNVGMIPVPEASADIVAISDSDKRDDGDAGKGENEANEETLGEAVTLDDTLVDGESLREKVVADVTEVERLCRFVREGILLIDDD